jgi:hypothetical protein
MFWDWIDNRDLRKNSHKCRECTVKSKLSERADISNLLSVCR